MRILGPSYVDQANLTLGAAVCRDGTIVYPAASPQLE
jgi:hypothetical protein